jgi:hypothetical protein
VIDCFTRFIELYPIRDLTAEAAAKALFQHFGRYGSASQLTSDNSRQFVNSIIEQLLELLGTEHTLALSHSHEENGIVERANKEVMRHLRAIIHDVKLEHAWSEMLPLVMRIFNSEVKEPIGVTPAQLLFGNAINLNRGFFAPLVTSTEANPITRAPPTTNRGVRNISSLNTGERSIGDYAAKMLKMQSDLIEVAQRTQRHQNAWHIAKDSNGRTEFAINSYVLVAYPRGMGDQRRPPSKLNTPWRGPLRVIRSHEEGRRYVLLNLVTNKEEIHHVSSLRAFIFDPMRIDPKDVAMSDQLEYWVDSVIAHRGDTRRVTNPENPFELQIHWTGFDHSKDSWEPWANVRLVDRVHDYLRTAGLSRLIPKDLD